jgi:hypothetical protein
MGATISTATYRGGSSRRIRRFAESSRLHRGCIDDASGMHQGCIRDASGMHEGCIRDASGMHQGCIEDASGRWKDLNSLGRLGGVRRV